jgi:hypothetical protein
MNRITSAARDGLDIVLPDTGHRRMLSAAGMPPGCLASLDP